MKGGTWILEGLEDQDAESHSQGELYNLPSLESPNKTRATPGVVAMEKPHHPGSHFKGSLEVEQAFGFLESTENEMGVS